MDFVCVVTDPDGNICCCYSNIVDALIYINNRLGYKANVFKVR